MVLACCAPDPLPSSPNGIRICFQDLHARMSVRSEGMVSFGFVSAVVSFTMIGGDAHSGSSDSLLM